MAILYVSNVGQITVKQAVCSSRDLLEIVRDVLETLLGVQIQAHVHQRNISL